MSAMDEILFVGCVGGRVGFVVGPAAGLAGGPDGRNGAMDSLD
jgi:hypothetical protein